METFLNWVLSAFLWIISGSTVVSISQYIDRKDSRGAVIASLFAIVGIILAIWVTFFRS